MVDLPDIQSIKPKIQRPIRQVGVEGVVVPFMLELKSGGFKSMVANVSMRTNIEADVKGISMSRLIRTLRKYLELPLKKTLVREILADLVQTIGSKKSYIRFDFMLPIPRRSVKSDYEFPIFHKCSFEGHLILYEEGENHSINEFRFFQGVEVQYSSYCPCSAELCVDLNSKGHVGFPHAQRSFAHLVTEKDITSSEHYVWLEDLIECVEKAVPTIPYPIIKRVDEQEIARIAGENPIFVEDAIRSISNQLDALPGVCDWIVKCIHEESIHTSEAIAVNWKGVEGGFNYRYFL